MDIIITAINNSHAFPVLARNLARDPSISLDKARSMLETLPVTYLKNVSHQEAEQALIQLRKLGVRAQITRSEADSTYSQDRNVSWSPSEEKKEKPHEEPKKRVGVIYRGPVKRVISVSSEKIKSEQKKKSPVKYLGWLILVLFVGLIIYLGNVQSDSFVTKKSEPLIAKKSKSKERTKKVKRKTKRKNGDRTSQEKGENRSTATSHEKKQAVTYIDSAKSSPDELTAIKFYQIAISFNRNNIDAWYGLINAYNDAEMIKEAKDARAEMRELFGDNVFTLTGIVELFGEPAEISRNKEGTMRVEYRSKITGQDELSQEAFRLIKALRNECKCNAISLFAQTGKGKGLLAYSSMSPFPKSFPEFKLKASINYLQ